LHFLEQVKLYNRYSQFAEDSIIEGIFSKIGVANKWCVECGGGDGIFFSNTRKLIEEGWRSLQIEADCERYKKLSDRYLNYGNGFQVFTENKKAGTAPNGTGLSEIFESYAELPTDFDLLIIDVDSSDYHLWNQLLKYQPRVVICEFDPNAEPDFIPEIDGPGQAGERAIHHVALARGYQPVCKTQVNLICVRNDLVPMLSDEQAEVKQEQELITIAVCASTPRVGFFANTDCLYQTLASFNLPYFRGEGVYWAATLSRAIKRALESKPKYILTFDYDTVWCPNQGNSDLAKLVCLLEDYPELDVGVPLQQKREGGDLLASSNGEVNLNQRYIPITRAHFGLTLFRSTVFERLAKPWFWEKANENGEWEENRVDSDIGFWMNCEEKAIKIGLATDVVIGHLELMVTWPSATLKPIYQHLNAWGESGRVPPVEAFTRASAIAAVLDMK
jgi:hypothetical protein